MFLSSLHSKIKIALKINAVAEVVGAGIALELRIVPARQGAGYAINFRAALGYPRPSTEHLYGTSQVNDDFHSAGFGRHHFKRHGTSGLDAYSALSDARGHQTVSYVSRPCQGKSMIVFNRSCIGGGEAENSNGR